MAEAVELQQPGIEVLQVFQTENPTVVVPTLMPCITAVCNQVLQVLVDNGSGGFALNSQAKVDVPAYVLCDDPGPGGYTAADLAGKSLLWSINLGPDLTITFPITWSGSVSAKVVSDFLNDAFTNANVYQDCYALAYGTAMMVRTRGGGDQQSIGIKPAAVGDRTALTALAIPEDHVYHGVGAYGQRSIVIPEWAYPDPRGNLDYLSIEFDTTRAFLYLGSGLNLQEGLQNQALLRWGDRSDGATPSNACNDILVMDDGNGDAISPIVAFNTGVVAGEDLTSASAPIVVTGTVDIDTAGAAISGLTLELDAGAGPQTITFLASIGAGGGAAWCTWLESVFPDLDFALNGSKHLTITTQSNGVDAFLQVVGGTGMTLLGLTAMGPYTADRQVPVGTAVSALEPHPVKAGDLLYVDGIYKGKVLQVAPRGTTALFKGEVKLDKQYPITGAGAHFGNTFYFVSQRLPADPALDRPNPDMTVDANTGDVTFKSALVREPTGKWQSVSTSVYLQYTALRKDVSPAAERPALLRIDTTTMLDSLIEPINPSNPFGVGMYLALINSSGAQISGIGVGARSDSEPYGTLDAFTRVFEFLESKEVYAIAPLTDDRTIAQIANAHASMMGKPEYKGERLIIFSLPKPTHAVDLLVASGVCNRAGGASVITVDTGIANLASLLHANGVDPSGTIAVTDGVYLTVEDDSNHYSVKTVTGSFVTLRYQAGEFAAGENDDAFYLASGSMPTTPWIDFAFNISVRGAELLLTDGSPDKDAIADTYQDLGKSFGSRRFWNLVLDRMYATFDGVSQSLPGFYMCAAYAGMIGGQPPQQSFTNFPIIGMTQVTGTNDYFSTRQLNRIAAGGNTIIVQDPETTGAIFARMALTTDMTSIETRTDNITKCLDFTAKFLRKSLRTFIGRFNINQAYLDTLSHVVQGLLQFLTGTFVLVDAEINNLVQDESAPDTVLLDITVDPPYPCNYIRVRLIV